MAISNRDIRQLVANAELLVERTAALHGDLRVALRNDVWLARLDKLCVTEGVTLDRIAETMDEWPKPLRVLAVRALVNRISAARASAQADHALDVLSKL